MKFPVLTTVFAAVCSLLLPLYADDTEASRIYALGHDAYTAGNYYSAAKLFAESELEADSPVIKANSIKSRIAAWQMCEMPYREFTDIETLLEHYPEFADFEQLSLREFELGDIFYSGKREPAFYPLRWIGFLHNGDKTIEIYTKALERAPFSPKAPQTLLRLAFLLDREGKTGESVEYLKTLTGKFPEAPEYSFGLLALAEGLMIMAEAGDGDGTYSREAFEALKLYQKLYPDSKQIDWVKLKKEAYYDLMAERELELADYYEARGRYEAAKRHLALVLSEYPQSRHTQTAESRLVKLAENYLPGAFPGKRSDGPPKLQVYKVPEEASRVLLLPDDGTENHRLQPVPDLLGAEAVLLPTAAEESEE